MNRYLIKKENTGVEPIWSVYCNDADQPLSGHPSQMAAVVARDRYISADKRRAAR